MYQPKSPKRRGLGSLNYQLSIKKWVRYDDPKYFETWNVSFSNCIEAKRLRFSQSCVNTLWCLRQSHIKMPPTTPFSLKLIILKVYIKLHNPLTELSKYIKYWKYISTKRYFALRMIDTINYRG